MSAPQYSLAWLLGIAAFVLGAVSGQAQPPAATQNSDQLTTHINQFIAARWRADGIDPAPRCDDRVFVRRIYLDLAGRVPTPTEVTAFLDADADTRRAALVDALLASEDYVQHFADLFDAILMGRAAESKYTQRNEHHWRAYLERVFRENRPWDQVAEEILLARPAEEAQRGAVWYLYERNNNHQQIAESIARGIFGIRIECAQCHDHMTADEIGQEHYWGLVAFFNRSQNVETDDGPRVAESAVGGFSEFADIFGDTSPNVLTFVAAREVPEERPEPGEEQADSAALYRDAASAGQPRIPIFSRRERFVTEVLPDHPLLARAAVNRLWAILMGRGIVHPHDEMDSMHPPSHPELLDWLSQQFVAGGYAMRPLVRAIVLSDAYQLASQQPSAAADPASFAWYLERPLTAEQLARSIALILRGEPHPDGQLVPLLRQQFTDVLPEQYVGTVADSLFLSNNRDFDQYLGESDQPDHLIPRLAAFPDAAERVETLFQVVLGRAPDADELAQTIEYLQHRHSAPSEALRQVAWAMITSAEFRLNH